MRLLVKRFQMYRDSESWTDEVSIEQTDPDLGGLRRKERPSRENWGKQGSERKCGRLTAEITPRFALSPSNENTQLFRQRYPSVVLAPCFSPR